MAGRKRRMLTLEESAAPVQNVNKRERKTDLNVSDPGLKRSFCCENGESAETTRSNYFTEYKMQSRLREDFFHQPCISLAKALLGKVSQSSAWFKSWCRNFQLNPLALDFSFSKNLPLIENISSYSENLPPCTSGVDPQVCGWYWAAGEDSWDWSLPWGGGQSLSLSGREAHAEEYSHVHEAWHHLRVSHLWHLPLHERVQWR